MRIETTTPTSSFAIGDASDNSDEGQAQDPLEMREEIQGNKV